MKVIFDKKGKFIEYKERDYYLGSDTVKNKVIRYTKLWKQLEEVVKGRDVRIVVFEENVSDDGSAEGRVEGYNNGLYFVRQGNKWHFLGYGFDDVVIDKVDIVIGRYVIKLGKNGNVILIDSKSKRRSVHYNMDFEENKMVLEVGRR